MAEFNFTHYGMVAARLTDLPDKLRTHYTLELSPNHSTSSRSILAVDPQALDTAYYRRADFDPSQPVRPSLVWNLCGKSLPSNLICSLVVDLDYDKSEKPVPTKEEFIELGRGIARAFESVAETVDGSADFDTWALFVCSTPTKPISAHLHFPYIRYDPRGHLPEITDDIRDLLAPFCLETDDSVYRTGLRVPGGDKPENGGWRGIPMRLLHGQPGFDFHRDCHVHWTGLDHMVIWPSRAGPSARSRRRLDGPPPVDMGDVPDFVHRAFEHYREHYCPDAGIQGNQWQHTNGIWSALTQDRGGFQDPADPQHLHTGNNHVLRVLENGYTITCMGTDSITVTVNLEEEEEEVDQSLQEFLSHEDVPYTFWTPLTERECRWWGCSARRFPFPTLQDAIDLFLANYDDLAIRLLNVLLKPGHSSAELRTQGYVTTISMSDLKARLATAVRAEISPITRRRVPGFLFDKWMASRRPIYPVQPPKTSLIRRPTPTPWPPADTEFQPLFREWEAEDIDRLPRPSPDLLEDIEMFWETLMQRLSGLTQPAEDVELDVGTYQEQVTLAMEEWLLKLCFETQHPLDTALAIYDEESQAGKSTLVDLLRLIVGNDVIHTPGSISAVVESRFNARLAHTILIYIEEVANLGLEKSAAFYKEVITGTERETDVKYKANGFKINLQNITFLIFSNHRNCVPGATRDDRRTLAVEADSAYHGENWDSSRQMWTWFHLNWKKPEFQDAFRVLLLQRWRDLGPQELPHALRIQRLHSTLITEKSTEQQSPVTTWLDAMDRLERGELAGQEVNRVIDPDTWTAVCRQGRVDGYLICTSNPSVMLPPMLYSAFRVWCTQNNMGFAASKINARAFKNSLEGQHNPNIRVRYTQGTAQQEWVKVMADGMTTQPAPSKRRSTVSITFH